MAGRSSRSHLPFHLLPHIAASAGWLLLVAAGCLVLYPQPVPAAGADASDAAASATPQSGSPMASSAAKQKLTEADWRRASVAPIAPGEIDALVAKELKSRNVQPAPLTSDEQFIRRVSLDLTGQLPDPAALTAFVDSTDPAKRARLIDQLLESDAWARHWARFWRDVVSARITNRRSMGLTRSFEEWLYEQFRENRSWGEITRDILTAEGELRFSMSVSASSGLVNKPGWQPRPDSSGGELFFLVAHDTDEAEERAAETSRVFLGIQIQCAQCHDHFTESWKREQFHQLAAYFSRIRYQQLFEDSKLTGVQLVIHPDREHRMVSLKDPDSSSIIHPRFLDGRAPARNLSDRERRQALADVIVDPENYWFAAAWVNRVWRELTGQSFYENVDDLGPEKTVVAGEVLTRLAAAFRGSNYDMKAMFRSIANSDTYQRRLDTKGKSREQAGLAAACPVPLRADVLWDSLERVLGRFGHSQFLTRGGKRFNVSILEGKFKQAFDFDPAIRHGEIKGTIPQTLFLMNNPDLNKRIRATRTNFPGQLHRNCPDDGEAVTAIYRHVLVRKPTERELARCLKYIRNTTERVEAFEDILWVLINSTEFQTRR